MWSIFLICGILISRFRRFWMKVILRILMIVSAFVIVLVPRATIGLLYYWLTAVVLVLSAGLYVYFEFFVSKKKIAKVLKTDDFYSTNVAMLPEKVEDAFVHGRLVSYNGMLMLYSPGKKGAQIKWSEDLDQIESLVFQKVKSKRNGFVISTSDHGDIEFESRIKKDEDKNELISNLGLEFDND